jgi:membrane fusion protein, type I secretion system
MKRCARLLKITVKSWRNRKKASMQPEGNSRGHIWAGFGTIALLLGGLGVWGTQVQIAGAVISSGQIMVEMRQQVVQHPDGGVVGDILVQNGDTVAAGDVLLSLDGFLLTSESGVLQQQLDEQSARAARLKGERDGVEIRFAAGLLERAESQPEVQEILAGQRRLATARVATLNSALDALNERKLQISDEIAGQQAQLRALDQEVDILGEELKNMEVLLAKGLAEASRVLSLRREDARLLGRRGDLLSTVARNRGRISEIGIEQIRLRDARREEAITQLRDLLTSQAELRERQLAIWEQMSRLEIRAPVAGVIHGMQVFAVNSVVQPGQTILNVVPQNTDLILSTRVAAINIDSVYIGQVASIRFPALDSRSTPELIGRVAGVSPDVLIDQATGQSFYSADLTLDPGQLERLGGQMLIPGMPVEAFIKTSDRTPLSYLLKPLSSYFARAFREE